MWFALERFGERPASVGHCPDGPGVARPWTTWSEPDRAAPAVLFARPVPGAHGLQRQRNRCFFPVAGFRRYADERFPSRQYGMIGWRSRPLPKHSPLCSIFGMSEFPAWCINGVAQTARGAPEPALRFQVLEEGSRQRSSRRPHPALTERLPHGIRKSCPIITRNRHGPAPSGVRGFRRVRHTVESRRTSGTAWCLRFLGGMGGRLQERRRILIRIFKVSPTYPVLQNTKC